MQLGYGQIGLCIKTKLKGNTIVKGTLRKQSNKHQNLKKTLLSADKQYELHASFCLLSELFFVNCDVCSIAFEMHFSNGVPF